MVPKCLFMQPGSIGPTRGGHTTYIQNNFYGGGSRPQNIWTYRPVCPPPVYTAPTFSFGVPTFLPHYVTNAADRYTGFSLLSGIFNFTKQATDYINPEQNIQNTPNQSEIDEVNNRYNA